MSLRKSCILTILTIIISSMIAHKLFRKDRDLSVDIHIGGVHIKGEDSPKSHSAYYDTIITNTNAFDVSIILKEHIGNGGIAERYIFRLNSEQECSMKIFHSDIILIRRILPDENQVDLAVGTLNPK